MDIPVGGRVMPTVLPIADSTGLSLRDLFALQTLPSAINTWKSWSGSDDEFTADDLRVVTDAAYEMADYMLESRAACKEHPLLDSAKAALAWFDGVADAKEREQASLIIGRLRYAVEKENNRLEHVGATKSNIFKKECKDDKCEAW